MHDINELYKRIIACMDELAEAKGVSRCGLMYALANLMEALKQSISCMESDHSKQLAEIEGKYQMQIEELKSRFGLQEETGAD